MTTSRWPSIFNKVARAIAESILTLTIFALYVPWLPGMPAAGLDSSWHYATNEAVARGLMFGVDFVMTFGPYAAILTRTYHPATDGLVMAGSIYLAFCFSLAVLILLKKTGLGWIIAFIAILASGLFSAIRDVLLFSHVLLLCLVTYRLALPVNHERHIAATRGVIVSAIPVFASLAMLPMIKSSLLPYCIVALALCYLMLIQVHKKSLAYGLLLVVFSATPVFWKISGQSLGALPSYVVNSFQFVTGYTDAMSLPNNRLMNAAIAFYLVAAAAVLYVVYDGDGAPRVHRVLLFLCFGAFLFISFKAGFTREIRLVGGAAILAAAVMLNVCIQHKHAIGVLFLSTLAWISIDQDLPEFTRNVVHRATSAHRLYTNAIKGIQTRVYTPNKLYDSFVEARSKLQKESRIPLMSGSSDIYSFGQSYLIASGNRWSPRPVFQSYAAYTPALARLNEAHLRGKSGPDNILFRLEPIDSRLPALEDGISWPTLLGRYSLSEIKNDYLYLTKAALHGTDVRRSELSLTKHRLGVEVPLPSANGALFAEIDIRPTFLGRLTNFLYKSEMLEITLDLGEGKRKTFRVIAAMARAGFLISPLVTTTTEFSWLYGDPGYWSHMRVKSMKITAVNQSEGIWSPEYTMKLTNMAWPVKAGVSSLFSYDSLEENAPDGSTQATVAGCEGFLDLLGGRPPIPEMDMPISRMLFAEGWLAVEASKGLVPETVYVLLTDDHGATRYVRAKKVPRPDVNRAFHRPDLSDVGFRINADVGELGGRYTLGIARVYKGRMQKCAQISQRIVIQQ